MVVLGKDVNMWGVILWEKFWLLPVAPNVEINLPTIKKSTLKVIGGGISEHSVNYRYSTTS